jgi:hypothetical protein
LLLVAGCSPGEAPPAARTDIPPAPRFTSSVTIGWLPVTVMRHASHFVEAADAHALDADLLAIVALVESGGWVHARSASGARGLMQLLPSTARDVAASRGLEHDDDALDEPARNVDLGAWYFAQQLEAFRTSHADESIELAAAAYNAGPNALRLHLDEGGPLSDQTRRYRSWISGMWRERHHARSPTLNAWIEAGGGRLLAKAEAEMRER